MRLSLIEVLFRLIPETCFVNYSITMLSNNKFDKNKYMKACLIAVVCGYIIRSLPISSGIHIILNVISFAAIAIMVNKYDVVDAIRSIIMVFVIMMVVEGLNILAILCISKELVDSILIDPVGKIVLGIPSIISYAVIAFLLYLKDKKKGEITDDCN